MPFQFSKRRREENNRVKRIRKALGGRNIVLVGLMGAGKTVIGRRLAKQLSMTFLDADFEIEKAAGMKVVDIFEQHGEAGFREGEAKVIARILAEGPVVLATGGGAFMNEATRKTIAETSCSVWLKADLDVLMERVSRNENRPLLKNDNPRGVMEKLMTERHPVYETADICVLSRDVSHHVIVGEILAGLDRFLAENSG